MYSKVRKCLNVLGPKSLWNQTLYEPYGHSISEICSMDRTVEWIETSLGVLFRASIIQKVLRPRLAYKIMFQSAV